MAKYFLISFLFIPQLFLFTACNMESTPSTPAPVDINSTSAKRHWQISSATLPLQLAVSTDFSVGEKEAITAVKEEWNSTGVGPSLIKTTLATTPSIDNGSLSEFRDGTLGIYKINNWFNEVGSSALAVTQFFAYPRIDASGRAYYEIVHADILVNYQDHEFSTNPAPYSFEYDLKSVIVHELGHLLGLGHVNDFSIDSVMHPTLSLGEQRRSIHQKDEDDIVDLYNPSGVDMLATRISSQSESKIVRGIIELQENGKCKHYFLPIK